MSRRHRVFQAETESPHFGKLKWTGTVRGERLEATAMMVRDGREQKENWVIAGLKR